MYTTILPFSNHTTRASSAVPRVMEYQRHAITCNNQVILGIACSPQANQTPKSHWSMSGASLTQPPLTPLTSPLLTYLSLNSIPGPINMDNRWGWNHRINTLLAFPKRHSCQAETCALHPAASETSTWCLWTNERSNEWLNEWKMIPGENYLNTITPSAFDVKIHNPTFSSKLMTNYCVQSPVFPWGWTRAFETCFMIDSKKRNCFKYWGVGRVCRKVRRI